MHCSIRLRWLDRAVDPPAPIAFEEAINAVALSADAQRIVAQVSAKITVSGGTGQAFLEG
ncbi:MAG: hypothetical protein NVS4B3_26180 [Gemmatimonadaceae bacterium]